MIWAQHAQVAAALSMLHDGWYGFRTVGETARFVASCLAGEPLMSRADRILFACMCPDELRDPILDALPDAKPVKGSNVGYMCNCLWLFREREVRGVGPS